MTMFQWINDLPVTTAAFLVTAAFVGFYWIGTVFFRPVLRTFIKKSRGANDVVGYILSSFCVFYGLLLGQIAVQAYQNTEETEHNVFQEVATLSALYQDLSGYREPNGENLRWLLRDYVRFVIKYAWPLQEQGVVPQEGAIRVNAFEEELLRFQPQSPAEQTLHAETLRNFGRFVELRRMRLNAVNAGIPAVLWYVVILGALANLALVWMFDIRFAAHLLLGGILSAYLGAMIFLIGATENPFRGAIRVPATPFETLHEQMLED